MPGHQRQRPRPIAIAIAALASTKENENEADAATDAAKGEEDDKSHNIFKQAYHLYVDYFDRLWSDTDVDQRQKLARQRAKDAVLHVKNMVSSTGGVGEEYLWRESSEAVAASAAASEDEKQEVAVFADLDEDVRRKMEEACDLMLDQLEKGEAPTKKKLFGKKEAPAAPTAYKIAAEESQNLGAAPAKDLPVIAEDGKLVSPAYYSATDVATTNETELTRALAETVEVTAEVEKPKEKKGGRSVLFGATMGLAVACWVYSGNYVFTTLFTLMTALGQLEYYRMVMNAGIYPARRISVVGACATFVTALFAPDLHQIVLPVFSTWAMIWFLTKRRSVSTISEIATTFTGMFYLGEWSVCSWSDLASSNSYRHTSNDVFET